MKVWSQGLGRTELVFDFKECVRNGDEVYLMGETTKPTKWQLKVTVFENDTPALMKVALSKKMIRLVVQLSSCFALIRLQYHSEQFVS